MAHVQFEVQYPSGAGRRVLSKAAARAEVRQFGGRWIEVPIRDQDDSDAEWTTFRENFKPQTTLDAPVGPTPVGIAAGTSDATATA